MVAIVDHAFAWESMLPQCAVRQRKNQWLCHCSMTIYASSKPWKVSPFSGSGDPHDHTIRLLGRSLCRGHELLI
jgi:hypothetical protein